MPFETIKTNRLYLLVTEQILHGIATGEHPPGSRLPQERQLSEILGVSRPSIREALAVLEVLGAVETRPGQGTFVRDSDNGLQKALSRISSPIRDVIQARQVCEIGIAELLASDHSDLSPAKRIVDLSVTAHEQEDVDRFVDLGLSFHNTLAECTDNNVLYHILQTLTGQHDQPVFRLLNKQAMTTKLHRMSQIREHRDIIAAIENGDSQGIRDCISHHLNGLEGLMTL